MQSDHHASGTAATTPTVAAERRTATQVREHFEQAVALLAPFFKPANQWRNMPLNHLAMRVLREHFESLTSAEIVIMYEAIRNLHQHRRRPVPCSRT